MAVVKDHHLWAGVAWGMQGSGIMVVMIRI